MKLSFLSAGRKPADAVFPNSNAMSSMPPADGIWGQGADVFGSTAKHSNKPSPGTFASNRRVLGPLVAIVSTLGAFWFMKQSYEGHKDIWAQQAAAHHTDAEMNFLREGWGMYSGQPAMDHAEHKLKSWLTFGPNSLLTHYHEKHAKSSGFIKDVIIANLFPIGVAIGSIYLGFGTKKVNGALGKVFGGLKPKNGIHVSKPWTSKAKAPNMQFPPNAGYSHAPSFDMPAYSGRNPMGYQQRVDAAFNHAWNPAAQNTVRESRGGIARLFSGGKLVFAIPIALLGLFAFHQFQRVWNHMAQEDLFRDWIHGHDH